MEIFIWWSSFWDIFFMEFESLVGILKENFFSIILLEGSNVFENFGLFWKVEVSWGSFLIAQNAHKASKTFNFQTNKSTNRFHNSHSNQLIKNSIQTHHFQFKKRSINNRILIKLTEKYNFPGKLTKNLIQSDMFLVSCRSQNENESKDKFNNFNQKWNRVYNSNWTSHQLIQKKLKLIN